MTVVDAPLVSSSSSAARLLGFDDDKLVESKEFAQKNV
jgi:hypothetical protein